MRCLPDYLQQYSNGFGKIGCLKGKHHIIVDREVPPVVIPLRHTCTIQNKTKWRIGQNGQHGNYHSHRRLEFSYFEKPNRQLWICLDPWHLNQAGKLAHFIMPTAEEILVQMSNVKFFTILDASNAYWLIPVDDESSKLFTFNFLHGHYCFCICHMAFI